MNFSNTIGHRVSVTGFASSKVRIGRCCQRLGTDPLPNLRRICARSSPRECVRRPYMLLYLSNLSPPGCRLILASQQVVRFPPRFRKSPLEIHRNTSSSPAASTASAVDPAGVARQPDNLRSGELGRMSVLHRQSGGTEALIMSNT